MADYNEIRFEQEVAGHVAAHGWLYSSNDDGYDRERALFPEDIFGGWTTPSPTNWRRPQARHPAEQARVLDRLVKVLGTPLESGGGTLNVLRKRFSQRLRQKWGKLGGIAVARSDEKQRTKAWGTGAVGEERLGARLDSLASESIAVLHDRRIPGTRGQRRPHRHRSRRDLGRRREAL